MAQKSPPSTSTHGPQLTINPSAPSSISASQSNTLFTPRSSTFPDGLDSDSEFDVLEPTPLHSPGGPQYDDLPPSYDEAQQQALQDARNGIPPLDPNQVDHDLQRLRLSDEQLPRELQSEVWEYRAPNPNLPNQGQRNVPVHQVQNSEQIPVGNMSNDNLPRAAPPDPSTILLNRALEFTRHEPDADVLYAPRLNRCIAIPQENIPFSGSGEHRHRRNGRDTRRQRRGRRGSRDSMNIPGQWPETASTETLQKETANPEDNIRFLRAYAKPLHAHSIRPAEFAEFLDGLNALCQATNSSGELVGEDSNDSLVQNYIKSANEAFFAPRGLKVSLQSFSSLLETSKVPEERGQQAGAIASVMDPTSNAEKRAQALHPWIEALDTNVPSPSAQMVLLQEMGECVRRRNRGQRSSKPPSEKAAPRATESEDTDPPHSIPEPDQAAGHTIHHNNDNHGHPGWGGWGGWGGPGGFRGRGRCGGEGRERGPHRGHPWTPFGPPGHGPFGAPGNTPFGRPSHGPFGAPGNGPFGRHGHGPFGAPGNGPFGPPGFGPFGGTNMGRGGGHSCHSARNGFGPEANCPNNWAAWGESIGKWGEAFGKRVEDWGQQFGQRAEEWGRDFGNRAETWGEDVAGGPSRNWPSPGAASGPAGETERGGSTHGPEGLTGQETGIERQDSNTVTQDTVREEKGEKPDHHIKKEAHNDNDDDDDASSISSSDSDCSSDSDSDSDADEDAYPDTHATFLQRIHTINTNFEAATQKGKKPASTLAQERSLAIERASQEKALADLKVAEKKRKRDIKKALRQTKKEIRKEHRRVKKELKVKHASVDGKGGLKKAKRSKEWRDAKVAYRAKKKELRREKMGLRRKGREGEGVHFGVGGMKGVEGMVWVVVGNLED